jgi:vesicle-fusing ATPase
MGPAAVLELTLLPRQWQDLPTVFDKNVLLGGACGDMTIAIVGAASAGGASDMMTSTHSASGWDPSMLQLLPETEDQNDAEEEVSISGGVFQSLEGKELKDALAAHFQNSVGGLQPQIDAIVRRVLDGRSIYSSHAEDDTARTAMKRSRLEAEELLLLGLQPVRGLLLYGLPGVGKTLIVREIASLLSSRPPKIVAASELLDRWVGGSERLVRELFKDAEQELELCQMAAVAGEEDAAFLNSALHVIVIDEIDAVFRKRVDSNDSGSNTRNSVVNQLLAKLDGVNALPNVLMIGMTNRKELIDPALLRPGRLEVQIEIPLPKRSQRREILQIHFGALRRKNRLSFPLRCAIDGVAPYYDEGDISVGAKSTRGRKRRALKRAAGIAVDFISTKRTVYDLADETEGFSGADIEGLVRCAGSRALSRARQDGGGVASLIITLDDVKEAIDEVKD